MTTNYEKPCKYMIFNMWSGRSHPCKKMKCWCMGNTEPILYTSEHYDLCYSKCKEYKPESEELKEKIKNYRLEPSERIDFERYKQALEKIEEIAKQGLRPICYKSNCNRCQCYDGDDSKIAITNLINDYFTEDGFIDDDSDFYEALEGLVENERASCNKAKPISNEILSIINKLK